MEWINNPKENHQGGADVMITSFLRGLKTQTNPNDEYPGIALEGLQWDLIYTNPLGPGPVHNSG